MAPLPLPGEAFELVTSRHPVSPDWPEIHRVLAPGGHYLAQHVGPASVRGLTEYFLDPLTHDDGRDPRHEAAAAEAAGLDSPWPPTASGCASSTRACATGTC